MHTAAQINTIPTNRINQSTSAPQYNNIVPQPRPVAPSFPRPQFSAPPSFPAPVQFNMTSQYPVSQAMPSTASVNAYGGYGGLGSGMPMNLSMSNGVGGYGGMPQMNPMMMPMGGMPGSAPTFGMGRPVPPMLPPRGPPGQAAVTTMDPNNDKSAWSTHDAPDGRKYWFNKLTNLSTYDKPLCLKTPEERSIPPCAWKEYVADGKKYYNNGTESV